MISESKFRLRFIELVRHDRLRLSRTAPSFQARLGARGQDLLLRRDTWFAFLFVIWNVHEGTLATRRLLMLMDQNLIRTLEGVEVIL